MPEKQPQFWELIAFWLSGVAAWAVGEGGRLYLAGAAGGLTRAILSRSRRMIEGVGSVAGGAMCAAYLWPVALTFLDTILPGDLPATIDNQRMAAFVAGLGGMSFVKLILALFDGWSGKMRGQFDGKG